MKSETDSFSAAETQPSKTEQPAAETQLSETEQSATEKQLSETEEPSTEETKIQIPEMEEPVLPTKAAAQPGKRTLYNLLLTAIEPLGHTMYVWGGGWNEEDTAAGEEARSIGESPRWKEFFEMQDSTYNYENTRYQIHDGLDCSGYVGCGESDKDGGRVCGKGLGELYAGKLCNRLETGRYHEHEGACLDITGNV